MARLLIYDAYENKVYTYANLNERTTPCPTAPAPPTAGAGSSGKICQPHPVDHHCGHGSMEPDPPQVRQGHPVGYAFRRIWEGGHGTRSPALRGVSFDVGQSLT